RFIQSVDCQSRPDQCRRLARHHGSGQRQKRAQHESHSSHRQSWRRRARAGPHQPLLSMGQQLSRARHYRALHPARLWQSVVQRINTARARIQGLEGAYELNLPAGRAGSISPFGTLGWLKGADLTPDETSVALIKQFYNRSDTAIRLRGSVNDAPLAGITPFRGIFGLLYNGLNGRWLGQYQVRYQSQVTRVAPLDLSSTILTQYGTLAGLRSLVTQSLRAGYTMRRE